MRLLEEYVTSRMWILDRVLTEQIWNVINNKKTKKIYNVESLRNVLWVRRHTDVFGNGNATFGEMFYYW
jgi:hypothetical protein